MDLLVLLWTPLSLTFNTVKLVVYITAFYIFFLSVYRLLLHPLARYPGPFLAKLTDGYGAYKSFTGKKHLDVWRLHQVYGPIVRIGPNKLMFSSPSALHTIYKSRNFHKSNGYTALDPKPGSSSTISEIDPAVHRRKRRAVNHAFSRQALKSFEPIMIHHVDRFIDVIQKHFPAQVETGPSWSNPVNLAPLLINLTLDVSASFGFGHSFDLQTSDKNHGILGAIAGASKLAGAYLQYPKLKLLRLERYVRPRDAWGRGAFGKFIGSLVQARLQEPKRAHPDILSFILDTMTTYSKEKISIGEIWSESRVFLAGGSNTIAVTISAALFYLSRNHQCYEKLVRTIRNSFASIDEIVSGTELSQCTYLRAVIDESLRLTPPGGTTMWREIMSDAEVIDNDVLPGGVNVACALYTIFHDKSLFPQPFEFLPERWLSRPDEHGDQQFVKHHAFYPFSLGSRNCVGQSMAYMEISLVLARLIWTFDFRRVGGPEGDVGAGREGGSLVGNGFEVFQIEEHITPTHNGPVLQFRCRCSSESKD